MAASEKVFHPSPIFDLIQVAFALINLIVVASSFPPLLDPESGP